MPLTSNQLSIFIPRIPGGIRINSFKHAGACLNTHLYDYFNESHGQNDAAAVAYVGPLSCLTGEQRHGSVLPQPSSLTYYGDDSIIKMLSVLMSVK